MEFNTSPKRPYLARAYYDWIVDNNLTPYLVVDATYFGVDVPQEYVREGQIILNIAPEAVGNLALGNDAIEFNARFQGVPRNVYVPLGAVIALYARENGDGKMFDPEPIYDELNQENSASAPSADKKTDNSKSVETEKKSTPNKSASHLRIVK